MKEEERKKAKALNKLYGALAATSKLDRKLGTYKGPDPRAYRDYRGQLIELTGIEKESNNRGLKVIK